MSVSGYDDAQAAHRVNQRPCHDLRLVSYSEKHRILCKALELNQP